MAWTPPVLAGAMAVLAVRFGIRGVDLPAQLYRVGLFQRYGLTLWDSQWYGGHWTLGYSVIFPPVAGVLGVGVTEVASAIVAAWAFDRLLIAHFGSRGRIGGLLFAAGTLVQVSIGQLPFLLGEALALAAVVAISRRRLVVGAALALASGLASPLAGAFLALGLLARVAARWPTDRTAELAIAASAIAPSVVLALVFPGEGAMPFPSVDFVRLAVVFPLPLLLLPRRERGLRIGAALYLTAIVGSFAVSSPVGPNVARLGECVGAPLAVCALWGRRRLVLVVGAVMPLLVLQWSPAFAEMSTPPDQSNHAAYYTPLVDYVLAHDSPAGRVEVVPTARHWEAAFVAPALPLARGWERQLDTARNPLFYEPGALTGDSYLHWLHDNGVRFVALPDATLDYAGLDEARLVSHDVPGLVPVWSDAHWRLYVVAGSSGLVEGDARLVRADASTVEFTAERAGPVVVRERYSPWWRIDDGHGCLRSTPSGWTEVDVTRAGPVRLRVGFGADPDSSCAAAEG